MKALFFCRKGCDYSLSLLNQMEEQGFHVTTLFLENRFQKLSDEILCWEGDYIFSFRCPKKIEKNILTKAKKFAINFHPASPDYPGAGSCSWAIFEKNKDFGVTAHIMDEKIDAGAIIECRRFSISNSITLPELWNKANTMNYQLARDFITGISEFGESFINKKIKLNSKEAWSENYRRLSDLDKLQEISMSLSKEDVDLIIRSTNFPGFPPYILFHGHRFELK